MDACVRHVDEVDVANVDIGEVFRHFFLKEPIEAHPLGGVGCAAGGKQVFVHARIRVVAVIPPPIGREHLIGMCIRVDLVPNAAEVCHLPVPVDLRGGLHGAVNSDRAHLRCHYVGDIDAAVLVILHGEDESDLLPAAHIVAVGALPAARRLENRLCLRGIIVIVLDVRVVVAIPLQGAIRRNALSEQNIADDRLSVDGIGDRRNEVTVPLPVGMFEVI